MKNTIDFLETSNPTVRFIRNCDIICLNCPSNTDNACCTEEKVSAIDSAFMKTCGITAYSLLRWKELKELSYRKIIQTNLLSQVCKDCQWQCWKTDYFQHSYIKQKSF